MVKLDVLLDFNLRHYSEAWVVLSLILILGDLEPGCSYKIDLIKKRVYVL